MDGTGDGTADVFFAWTEKTMATIRLVMCHKGGTQRKLYIQIQHGKRRTQLATPITVNRDDWDAESFSVRGRDARARLTNVKIRELRSEIEILLLRYELHTMNRLVDFDELVGHVKKEVLNLDEGERRGVPGFMEHFRSVIAARKPGTAGVYTSTYNLIMRLVPNADRLRFEDITPAWLRDLERMMDRHSAGYRSITMRNIRAVINDAIDREYTTNYPFRRYKIAHVETEKRSLSVGRLRLLNDWKCEPQQTHHRDMFMLSFCLIGMNLVDMCHLSGVTPDGRVEYRRAKTDRPYSIKIEPEAASLIERLRGRTHLLHVMDTNKDHHCYLRHINRQLKRIGYTTYGKHGKADYKPLFPELSTYWARHTWATIAAELDVPDATISAALGHSDCNRTTAIYIRRQREKVDAANRKVLDYVFGGIREGRIESRPGTPEYYGLTPSQFGDMADMIKSQ